MIFLRPLVGATTREHIRNNDIRHQVKVESVSVEIKKLQTKMERTSLNNAPGMSPFKAAME